MNFRSSSNTAMLQAMQGQLTTVQSQANTTQGQVNNFLNSTGGVQYVVATPVAGSTYNAVPGYNLIESGGLLATLTINLPTGIFDGQFLGLFLLNGITLASWSGAARNSSPLAVGALNAIQFIWDAGTTSWHRCV